MSYNVINQVVSGSGNTQIIRLVMKDNGTTSQTQTGKTQIIKQVVLSGERGPKGDPGVNGINGRDGADGKDGVVQYTAGTGITIENNTITADATSWGDIQGTMSAQTDLANALQDINNSISALGDYSTNETNTGAKWIDGKTIYKKTVNTGALPSNTSKSVSHGIGESWDRILKAEGYSYASMYGLNVMIPNSGIDIQVADADIEITTTSDYSGYNESYITLYYTKTS